MVLIRASVRAPVLAAVLSFSLAGCGGADGAPGSPAPTGPSAPAPTGSSASGPSASGPGVSPVPGGIGDGRHFAFVTSVDAVGGTVEFDLAGFLTGEEANEAAAERGDETPVPNDYYIVNDAPRLRTVAASDDLEVVLLDWSRCCDETFAADLDAFEQAIAAGEPITIDDRVYQGRTSPYWLTIRDGVLVRIEEQYLP